MNARLMFGLKILLMVSVLWCANELMKLYVGGPDVQQRLFNAVAEDDVDAMSDALAEGGNIRQINSAGQTLLMQAAAAGHEHVAAALLDRGVDPNAVNEHSQTALFYAAVCDRASVARLLVDRGVDPSHRDNQGETACDAARNFGSEQVQRCLEASCAPAFALHSTSAP